MRVTVMSPVSGDVTIAQAAKWLQRSGWRQTDEYLHPGVHSWELHDNYVWMPTGDSDEEVRTMRELIADVARVMEETPAFILQEMSEVRV